MSGAGISVDGAGAWMLGDDGASTNKYVLDGTAGGGLNATCRRVV